MKQLFEFAAFGLGLDLDSNGCITTGFCLALYQADIIYGAFDFAVHSELFIYSDNFVACFQADAVVESSLR